MHRTQLKLDRCIALFLGGLNEGTTDVAILDQSLRKRNPRFIGKSCCCRRPGIRYGDDNISAETGLPCQNTSHLKACRMDTLSINDGVRAREIDVFKNAGSNVFPIGKAIGFQPIAVNDNHFARQYIAHKFSAIDLKGACFRGEDPPAIRRLPDAQWAEPLWIAHTNQLILCHNRKAESTAHDLDRLKNTLLNGCLL